MASGNAASFPVSPSTRPCFPSAPPPVFAASLPPPPSFSDDSSHFAIEDDQAAPIADVLPVVSFEVPTSGPVAQQTALSPHGPFSNAPPTLITINSDQASSAKGGTWGRVKSPSCGKSAHPNSISTDYSLGTAIRSFFTGVLRGAVPLVFMFMAFGQTIGWRSVWDQPWLAYGTTVGFAILIVVLIVLIVHYAQ